MTALAIFFAAVLALSVGLLAWIVLRERARITAALLQRPLPPRSVLPQDEQLIQEAMESLKREGLM
jgi:hypothetical protein